MNWKIFFDYFEMGLFGILWEAKYKIKIYFTFTDELLFWFSGIFEEFEKGVLYELFIGGRLLGFIIKIKIFLYIIFKYIINYF